jgi:hypothetical protein
MSWVSSASCQADRRYECTYADYNSYDVQWCRDSDIECPRFDDGGPLIGTVDHNAPSGGGW